MFVQELQEPAPQGEWLLQWKLKVPMVGKAIVKGQEE